MKDIQKFINSRKRKKNIRKAILITVVIIIASVIFVTKASIFNITEINFSGNITIATEGLKNMVESDIGNNIFTVNLKSIKEKIKSNKYIKNVNISRKGISRLEIVVEEEAPVYYVEKDGMFEVLNNNMEVLESVESLEGRRLVKINGIVIERINDENNIKQIESQKKILEAFYPYIAENTQDLKLDSLDISNIVDIRGYMGNVEIFFGDYENLHNKMENVYRIMLSENIKLENGYINVSFKGSPVIKKNKE